MSNPNTEILDEEERTLEWEEAPKQRRILTVKVQRGSFEKLINENPSQEAGINTSSMQNAP